ncbi:MAG: DUF5055 domain-containing protein [Atopobiaceae bacterium]|nr:DUF5055 domain-containing protein [Atopobiaceae bacterium]
MPENEVTATEETPQPPKPVYFTYKGTDYTLEFSRNTARITEERYNIDVAEITQHVMCAPDLFKGALLLHHPNVGGKLAGEMWEAMTEKPALHLRLMTLFIYTVSSVFEEPDEGNGVSWQ